MIRACTRDGHAATLLGRPGVAADAEGRPLGPLPVAGFLDGLEARVRTSMREVPHLALLARDAPEARRLGDDIAAWIEAFNRRHGSALAWSLVRVGVSPAPRPDCPPAPSAGRAASAASTAPPAPWPAPPPFPARPPAAAPGPAPVP